ncbi:MAG TPA: hypothetical protein VLH81_01780, partial [Desulfobacterales bacterium]|nr:hypothetical protein [Desulfobacterales bacterium]
MRTDIESRINEAEVCRSMGLFSESLAIYEKILPSVPSQSADVMETIRGRIGLLRQEIAKEDATSVPGVSAREISWIREAISSSGDLSAILDSASAFQEMGLHEEAVNEYAKLLGENFPLEKVIPAFTESLLKLHSPAHVSAGVNALLESAALDSGKAARVKHLMGVELEKRDQRDAAHDLYKGAAELNPSDAEIAKSLASVAAAFASGSKYDYLLRERMVTTDQLQKAFGLAKKSNRSVEHVLIETFKIKKEAIGKSFSLFYGCKFRAFDPNVPAPFELLANLKKAFLLNELWIPMSWSKEGIEVLVDDPRNLNKTDNIKALLKTAKISVSVAIREDIQAFISHFFDKDRSADTLSPPEETTDD